MEYKTFTSALVLSVVLAGSAAVAMDEEEILNTTKSPPPTCQHEGSDGLEDLRSSLLILKSELGDTTDTSTQLYIQQIQDALTHKDSLESRKLGRAALKNLLSLLSPIADDSEVQVSQTKTSTQSTETSGVGNAISTLFSFFTWRSSQSQVDDTNKDVVTSPVETKVNLDLESASTNPLKSLDESSDSLSGDSKTTNFSIIKPWTWFGSSSGDNNKESVVETKKETSSTDSSEEKGTIDLNTISTTSNVNTLDLESLVAIGSNQSPIMEDEPKLTQGFKLKEDLLGNTRWTFGAAGATLIPVSEGKELVTNKTKSMQLTKDFFTEKAQKVQLSFNIDVTKGEINVSLYETGKLVPVQSKSLGAGDQSNGILEFDVAGPQKLTVVISNEIDGQASECTLKDLRILVED